MFFIVILTISFRISTIQMRTILFIVFEIFVVNTFLPHASVFTLHLLVFYHYCKFPINWYIGTEPPINQFIVLCFKHMSSSMNLIRGCCHQFNLVDYKIKMIVKIKVEGLFILHVFDFSFTDIIYLTINFVVNDLSHSKGKKWFLANFRSSFSSSF